MSDSGVSLESAPPKSKMASSEVIVTSPLTSSGTSYSCSDTFILKCNQSHHSYSFRSHPTFRNLSSMFDTLTLQQVRVHIASTEVDSSEGKVSCHTIRFGLAPRGLNATSSDTNIVYTIPHLDTVTIDPTALVTVSRTWSANDFPPGVQSDLRAVESRNKYVELFVGNCTQEKGDSNLVRVQVDFVVSCSGQGFGNVH